MFATECPSTAVKLSPPTAPVEFALVLCISNIADALAAAIVRGLVGETAVFPITTLPPFVSFKITLPVCSKVISAPPVPS